MINKGTSYSAHPNQFGIGKSSISDVKKNKNKIEKFVRAMKNGPHMRKTLKQPENLQIESTVFVCFVQQKRLHIPVSSEIICKKARIFHRQSQKNTMVTVRAKVD